MGKKRGSSIFRPGLKKRESGTRKNTIATRTSGMPKVCNIKCEWLAFCARNPKPGRDWSPVPKLCRQAKEKAAKIIPAAAGKCCSIQ